MFNQVEPLTLDDGPSPQIKQPSYNIGDLRFGIDTTKWSMQLYVNNLTDERAVIVRQPVRDGLLLRPFTRDGQSAA